MCKSARGAAYFGSTLHVTVGFVFLLWFLFDTVILEMGVHLWHCDDVPKVPKVPFTREVSIIAHYVDLFFRLVYFVLLFTTGIYMFRGVERESARTLKFTTLSFIILQLIGLTLFIMFTSIYWSNSNALGTEPTEAMVPSEASGPSAARLYGDELESSGNKPNSIFDELQSYFESDEEITTPEPTVIPELVDPTPSYQPDDQVERPVFTEDYQPEGPIMKHNDKVTFVFKAFLVTFNAIGSILYVIVVGVYMTKL